MRNWDAVVDELVAQMRAGWDEIKGAEGLMQRAQEAIHQVVVLVEAFAEKTGGMSGEDKSDIAADVLDELINIPVIPNWLENKIFRFAVSAVVHSLNVTLGHAWLKSI
jgi:phosphopantetheine adenylyltransferase